MIGHLLDRQLHNNPTTDPEPNPRDFVGQDRRDSRL
jgi:hypothetical protein